MKNIFLLIALILTADICFSQLLPQAVPFYGYRKADKLISESKGGAIEIYWSEDFSNGLDGQDDNGDWTTDGDQGELWFQTFPVDSDFGYDPDAPIPEYGLTIPNFFDNRDVVLSPTRDNGVIMLDADRFNSSRIDPEDDVTEHILNNIVDASLVSPSIDFSENPFADLCFYTYTHVCCNDQRFALVDLSTDGGDSWNTVDTIANLQDEFQGQVCVDLSPILAFAEDLTDCKIRFRWSYFARHFFWFLDDITIQSIPVNELVATRTWYRNYQDLVTDFENGTIDANEYYRSFEYHTTPDYALKPINLAMEVRNEGSAEQTGVVLQVWGTSPSGEEIGPFESEPVSVAPYTNVTLTIGEVDFGEEDGQIPVEPGGYSFEYIVLQDQDDELPENNIGQTRTFFISNEGDDQAVFRNGDDRYFGAFPTLGEDVIWGTAYAFDDDFENGKTITHIEAVLQFFPSFAETQAGEIIYFNLRKGAVVNEDPFDPETMTTVLFEEENPYDYSSSELAYEIQEEDIWNVVEDELPYSVWVSFELPNPVMVNPGEIYQAEFRVPPVGSDVVFPAISGVEEKYASFYYTYPSGEGQWNAAPNLTIPIWFRVASADDLSVDRWSEVNGIELLQNYPNPFNDVTRIQYRLDETSDVTFEVFDMSGRLVYAEDHGRIPAGIAQTFEFSAKSLSAGVYTYSIVSNGERVTRKLTIE
jgi:hypothetical protein